MAIAKGIENPVTGEVSLLQGAGYTYNEEKNSVAFGSETSAPGLNQVVFGKFNRPAADKAEIIGGGTMYSLGDVIVAGDTTDDNVNNDHDMIYAGKGLNEFKQFLQTYYNANLSEFSIADETRSVVIYIGTTRVVYNIPNVRDYNKLYFVVFETTLSETTHNLWVYGYSMEDDAIYQPFSEVQGSFTVNVNGTTKTLKNVGDTMTLRGLLDPVSRLSTTGNFYLSFKAIENKLKNIRVMDWSGNMKLAGGLELEGSLKLGDTTLTEAHLAALLELLNESES